MTANEFDRTAHPKPEALMDMPRSELVRLLALMRADIHAIKMQQTERHDDPAFDGWRRTAVMARRARSSWAVLIEGELGARRAAEAEAHQAAGGSSC